tara:strand:- start:2117 stop:3100 length:984 start_codon:yes stop_codon:yes gene_type:complete
MRFGKNDNFIFFGGGHILLEACVFLKKRNKNVFVISSKNQINEKTYNDKNNLGDHLLKNGIKYKILPNLNNIKKWSYLINKKTIGVSYSCRWIFKKKQIDLFNGKLLNIHASNLPSFRGAGGFTWKIMSQHYSSGLTIHFVNEKIDTGVALLIKSFKFPLNIRGSLFKMQKYSFDFQKKILKKFLITLINNGKFNLKNISNNSNSYYWPRISTQKNAWINWSWDAEQITNFIKSFSYPYEGAATNLKGEVVRFQKAKITKSKIVFHPFQYGLIYRIIKNEIYVAAKNYGVILDISNFKNKNSLLGKRLYSTTRNLEKSLENFTIQNN